jgi:hypothetical protein
MSTEGAADHASKLMANGYGAPLAIHIAHKMFHVTKRSIREEFTKRKKANKARSKTAYQATVPKWVKEKNEA